MHRNITDMEEGEINRILSEENRMNHALLVVRRTLEVLKRNKSLLRNKRAVAQLEENIRDALTDFFNVFKRMERDFHSLEKQERKMDNKSIISGAECPKCHQKTLDKVGGRIEDCNACGYSRIL